jgi:hypothetical protein
MKISGAIVAMQVFCHRQGLTGSLKWVCDEGTLTERRVPSAHSSNTATSGAAAFVVTFKGSFNPGEWARPLLS